MIIRYDGDRDTSPTSTNTDILGPSTPSPPITENMTISLDLEAPPPPPPPPLRSFSWDSDHINTLSPEWVKIEII